MPWVTFNAEKPQKLVIWTRKSVQSLNDLSKVTKKITNTTRELISFGAAFTQQNHSINHLSSTMNGPPAEREKLR